MLNKKLLLIASAAGLAGIGTAHAAINLNGGFGASVFGGSGSFSSSTLQLSSVNVLTGANGDFVSLLGGVSALGEGGSELTASTTKLTGIKTTPTTESVANYFVFATPGIDGATGSTPNNRFHFTLTSIEEVSSGDFTGTGLLSDASGVYNTMISDFSLSFAGSSNYSFSFSTVSAVPEPAVYGACTGALTLIPMGLGYLRSRKR